MLLDSIYDLLKPVNAKVYPGIVEQETEAPFIVHARVGTTPYPSKDGAATKDLVVYRVASYASTQREADSQAETIRETIDEYSGLMNGVMIEKIRYQDEENGFDNSEEVQLYYTMQTYKIWINYET